MWWHTETQGRGSEGETGEWREYPVLFTLPWNMRYPALLPLMRTPRLPVVDWTDAPADLNGFDRFAERRNLVSARVPSHFKRSLPPAGLSLVNTSYAAYASDETLNKRENCFPLTTNNIFKYSPGTTVGITKDISKYSSSILSIIINDISKHGPALFRQGLSSNRALHTGNYQENVFTNTTLAQRHFQIQSCHKCAYYKRIPPNTVFSQSCNSQNQHSAPPSVLQQHPTLTCLGGLLPSNMSNL